MSTLHSVAPFSSLCSGLTITERKGVSCRLENSQGMWERPVWTGFSTARRGGEGEATKGGWVETKKLWAWLA